MSCLLFVCTARLLRNQKARARSKLEAETSPPSVRIQGKKGPCICPHFLDLGWATYILTLQMKVRLKRVKEFAPSFITVAVSISHARLTPTHLPRLHRAQLGPHYYAVCWEDTRGLDLEVPNLEEPEALK